MTDQQKKLFESVVKYFDAFINLIPLSFVLGFYVSYVASRWWQQFLAIPWPDKLFHSVACYVEGFDDDARMLRRSLMRWMNLALILVLRSISSAVKQRFPTLDHVVEAGFMTPNEKKLFEAVPANEFNTYWVPCTWFVYRLQEATKQGKLLNQYALENIMREFCEFRAKCGLLWCYDWVSIPMVYTQVVTLATYLFFIFTIIGRQKLDAKAVGASSGRMPSNRIPLDIDLYFPIYTILQFLFYMGLLKVAEQLINPFGDDDEDFELNWLIDRHVKASFLGCDVLMNPERIPPLVKDFYWDKQDCPIPYTEASMHFKKKTYRGSADELKVPEDKCQFVLPEIEEEIEDEDQKLSLTSLLLESSNIMTNIGLGDLDPGTGSNSSLTSMSRDPELSPLGYDRSPRQPRVNPGARRNGHATDMLAVEKLQGSLDSMAAGEEEELALEEARRGSNDDSRRGSDNFLTARRGSRLSDVILMQERRKKNKGRFKDKQGFTWRPFIYADEELPIPRAPHPHIETPAIPLLSNEHTQQPPPQLQKKNPPIPIQPKQPPPLIQPKQPIRPMKPPNGDIRAPRRAQSKRSNNPSCSVMIKTDNAEDRLKSDDPETASIKSDNSFQTASSDPQINFIPRQISDSYKMIPPESAALERKSSVRALHQQQYIALNAGGSDNGAPHKQPARTQKKSVR